MVKTAEEMAGLQKEISVSEFFEKNKHLLGFDNPTKALLMTVKEAVDNSLDACEEAGILPDISVRVKNVGEEKFEVTVQDNGPGIVKEQVPRIFGKLLYGSKFHRQMQSRGQQGIGVSAVALFSQLTTGDSTQIWTKTVKSEKTTYVELNIDTMKNEPKIVKEEQLEKSPIKEHGTIVKIVIEGRYRKIQGIDDYLKQTSIANPFSKLSFSAPDGTKTIFPRSVNELPKQAKEMKPHPYGLEYGILQRMLASSKSRNVQSFIVNEFSSTGAQSAKEICKVAKVETNKKPFDLDRKDIERLLKAMQTVRLQRPPLDCLSPIGEKELEKSLKKEYPESEFTVAVTREPSVYRGTPFQIEVGIVYGNKDVKTDEDDEEKSKAIGIIRFANRVPLMYQAGAGAVLESVKGIEWKRYGMQQSGKNMPTGPMVLVVHMASSWVPFISESKEAIAPYSDIIKEMKLAIQDAGRQLNKYLSGKRREGEQTRRLQIFDRYSGEVATSLSILTEKDEKMIMKTLKELIDSKKKVIEKEEQEEAAK
jgi:DNA topoisomerase VI subunit B